MLPSADARRNRETRASEDAWRGFRAHQYSLGRWITLLAKYSVISSSGKSVCSISFGEHDVAVAIIARKRSGSVGTYDELPVVKCVGRDSLLVRAE